MQMNNSGTGNNKFNKILASVWKFNKTTNKFLFSKNSLIMFGISNLLRSDVWYGREDMMFDAEFMSNIINFNELEMYLIDFDNEKVVDFKFKLQFNLSRDEFYLEGFLDNDIVIITCIETETSKQIRLLENKGLIDSKIGLRWLERINDEYRIFHMNSSRELYGMTSERDVSRIIFSGEWHEIADAILAVHPEYISYFENNKVQFNELVEGECDSYILASPWLDNNGDIIWVEDRVTVLSRNPEGYAELIVATTIDVTESKLKEFSIVGLELRNKELLEASNTAINLAKLLVWRMNFEDYPKGNYVFSNETYRAALGLEGYNEGYIKFEDFLKTTYPDSKGDKSMGFLLEEYEKCRANESEEFVVIIKHQNLKTNEAVYLEHHTKVEKRFEDGSLKLIGGYIINITEKVIMEEINKKLNMEKERHLHAERLAIRSGRVMIWYLDSEVAESATSFYGNNLLFSKLGLTELKSNQFLIEEFNNSLYKDDAEGLELYNKYIAMDDRVEDNELDSYDKLLVKHQNIKTKEIFYFEHNFEVDKRYEDGRMMIRGGFMADVTEEITYKRRNDFLVEHDSVTGLYNRNAFEKFTKSTEMPKKYTLIIADIDGLKFINDAFGHLKGDEAIIFVGKEFETQFSYSSTIYRIGGDEFAVISEETDEEVIISHLDNIKANIDKLNSTSDIQLGVSLGYDIIEDQNTAFSDAFIFAENLMYRRKLSDRNSRKSKTMDAVLETLHVKTEETKEHCDRLGEYAVNTLKKLGYSRTSDLEDIELLCKVHDIGKITISEEILSKPGKLSTDEYNKIKSHSEAGYKIVKNIVESDRIAFGVLYHHERVDGTGYPFGLIGDEIPLFAKILSICDAYDVMISGRKYSKALSKKDAIDEIIKCSGTQFDKRIAKIFIETINE